MGIVDVVFLVILFIAFISGMQKGLITSFLACAAMVGALLIAKGLEGTLAKSFEGTSFSSWLYSNFSEAQGALQVDWNNWFHVLSFVIVFILAYAALMLVINLINNVFRIPKLKAVDGLLGGVLGLARGYASRREAVLERAAELRLVVVRAQGRPHANNGRDGILQLVLHSRRRERLDRLHLLRDQAGEESRGGGFREELEVDLRGVCGREAARPRAALRGACASRARNAGRDASAHLAEGRQAVRARLQRRDGGGEDRGAAWRREVFA